MTAKDARYTIIAKVVVWNSDGKVLVLRRSKTDTRRPLTWDLPGGLVEYGEHPRLAAIRETEEEAGIKLDGVRVVDVDSLVREGEYVISLIFTAEVDDPKVRVSWEHDQYKWVEQEELLDLDIPRKYKQAVKMIAEANGA